MKVSWFAIGECAVVVGFSVIIGIAGCMLKASDIISGVSRGIIRTQDKIIEHYDSKGDYSGLTTESARKFTTVPSLLTNNPSDDINVNAYTLNTPNDSFAFSVALGSGACQRMAAITYSAFQRVVINGVRTEDIRTTRDLCKQKENKIELIHTKSK
jgi:hypothetical protein